MTEDNPTLDPGQHIDLHREELRRRTILKGVGAGSSGALLPGLLGSSADANETGAQSEPDPDELPDEFTVPIEEFHSTVVSAAFDFIEDTILDALTPPDGVFGTLEDAISGAKEILEELVIGSGTSGLSTAQDKVDWLDSNLDDLPGALQEKADELEDENEDDDDSDDSSDSSDSGDTSESISPDVVLGSGASNVAGAQSTVVTSAFHGGIKDAAEDVMDAAEDGIDSISDALESGFDKLSDTVVEAAEDAWGSVEDAADAIATYIAEGIEYFLNQILSPLFDSLASVDLPPLNAISDLADAAEDAYPFPSVDDLGFADHLDIDMLTSAGAASGVPTSSESSSTSASSGDSGGTRSSVYRPTGAAANLADGPDSGFIGGETVDALCGLTERFEGEEDVNRGDHEFPYAFDDKRDLAISAAEEEINNYVDENADTTLEVGPFGVDGGFTLQDLKDPEDREEHPCDFGPGAVADLAPGVEINVQVDGTDTGTSAEIYPIFEFRVEKVCLHVAVLAEQSLPVSVEDIWDGLSYALGETYAAARSAAEILEVYSDYRAGYEEAAYLGNYGNYSELDATSVESDPVSVSDVESDTESIADDLKGIGEELAELQANEGMVTNADQLLEMFHLSAIDEELTQFKEGDDDEAGMNGVKETLDGPNQYRKHVELYWIAHEMGIADIPAELEKIGREGTGLRGDTVDFADVGLNALYLVDDVSTQRAIRQWVESLPADQQQSLDEELANRTGGDSGDDPDDDSDDSENIVERLGYEGPSSDGIVGRQLSMIINDYWSWFAEDYLGERLWQVVEETCGLDENLPPLEWEMCQKVQCSQKSKYVGEPVATAAAEMAEAAQQAQDANEDGGGEGDGDWLPDLTFPGIETIVKVLTFLALLVFFALLALGKIAILPVEAAALIVVGGIILIAILLQRLLSLTGTGFDRETGRRM